jgi:hypothetical protein
MANKCDCSSLFNKFNSYDTHLTHTPSRAHQNGLIVVDLLTRHQEKLGSRIFSKFKEN